MKNFEKSYIGKGKANQQIPGIVAVTIAMDKAESFIFEYEGKKYLRFEVAERMNPDQYGNTHTVYVNQMVEDEVVVVPVKKRGRKKDVA